MGVFAGPEITESGLVLSLDAANNKSILSAVEVLVVAGGGGGGMDMGGGGGGGGIIYNSNFAVTPGSAISANVGNGGIGAPAAGTNGQPSGHQYTIPATQGGNSVFGALIAIGGGFGGSSYQGYTPGIAGGNGGSGGGSSGYNDNAGTFLGGLGTTGQGNRGGNSTAAYYSGGGGGAGGQGVDSTNQPNGGVGLQFSILGVAYFWGGGGGGASYSLSNGGNGGNGGGGGGAVGTTIGGSGLNNGSPGGGGSGWANTPGGNAGANTGGGGGGGSHYNANNKGGDGGSGIVIVRYPGSQRATGGTVTSVGGHTIHTFTTSGTFTPNFGDMSGNGNNGELENGVGYNSGNLGALVFDGSNDYVSVSNTSQLRPSTELTISMWVKANSITAEWVRLFGQDPYAGGPLIFLETGGTLIRALHYPNGTEVRCNTSYPISTTLYTNIVFTFKMGDAIRSYFNGVANTTVSLSAGTFSYNTTNPYLIGHSGVSWFNGNISNISFYNRALTAAEVSQNFNATRSRYSI